MKTLIFDILLLIGFASVLFGCYTAWPPLSFVVGGVFLMFGSVLVFRESPRADRPTDNPATDAGES